MTDADAASIRQEVETTLTGQFDMKLNEMRRLNREADDRRLREEAERETRREVEEEEKREAEAELAQLAVDEATERTKRSKLQTKLLGFLVAAVTGGGGVGIAVAASADDETIAPIDVQATIDDRASAQDDRIDTLEKKSVVLKNMALEQIVLDADDGKYTRDLIRAAHPRQIRAIDAVDVPDSVPAAKKKADAIKKAAEDDKRKVFDELADPFAAIDAAAAAKKKQTEKP